MSANSREISDLMTQIDSLIPTRIKAVMPGAGTQELSDRLRSSDKSQWEMIFSEHAKERSAELCSIYKDGDLLYRDGKYWWTFYAPEFDDALRNVGCKRRRPHLEGAEIAFIGEVDAIRVRRLGPEDQQQLLDPDLLEWSPSFFEEYGTGNDP